MANTKKNVKQQKVLVSVPKSIVRKIKGSKRYRQENWSEEKLEKFEMRKLWKRIWNFFKNN